MNSIIMQINSIFYQAVGVVLSFERKSKLPSLQKILYKIFFSFLINFVKFRLILVKIDEITISFIQYCLQRLPSFTITSTVLSKSMLPLHVFFYKQHLYKQWRAEIGKKKKQKLSNTVMLNFCHLKIINFLYPRYHPKTIGDILKNVQKTNASIWITTYSNTYI